jgi:hypothetical protein
LQTGAKPLKEKAQFLKPEIQKTVSNTADVKRASGNNTGGKAGLRGN